MMPTSGLEIYSDFGKNETNLFDKSSETRVQRNFPRKQINAFYDIIASFMSCEKKNVRSE